ncbi:hypothetical protein H9P43_006597 [Blastocladiella emersonii ATCC 22665]|nr:hypothetical protein H9P43_006597 [Blastocladiella emersonii ATCC 22665]
MAVLSTTALYVALPSLARGVVSTLRRPTPALGAWLAVALLTLPITFSAVQFALVVVQRKWSARRGLYITSRDGTRRPVPGLLDASYVERYLTGDTRKILAAPSLVVYQQQQIAKYGTVHTLRDPGGAPGVVVADPRALHYLCTARAYATVKPPELARLFVFAGGQGGMLALEGDAHKVHRRVVIPLFNMKVLKQLVPTMHAAFDELEAILDRVAAAGEKSVDFQDLATRVTLNVIGRTALATEFDALRPGSPSTLTSSFAFLMRIFEYSTWNFVRDALPVLTYLPLPYNRKLWAARAVNFDNVDAILRRVASERAGGGRPISADAAAAPSMPLFTAFLDAVDGSNGSLTLHDMRDELLTFLGAGHETSSNLLGMLGYFLAKHPRVQAKLAADVDAFGVDSAYLGDVVNEALRVHSPAYSTMRLAAEDLQVPLTSGETLHVPKGLRLFYPIQAIHTNPELWGPDAHEFRPERWSDEVHVATTPTETLPAGKSRLIPPYGFYPFLGGPRACIGRAFAMLEIKHFVARLVARYTVRLADPKFVPTIEYKINARATEVPLVFARRDGV